MQYKVRFLGVFIEWLQVYKYADRSPVSCSCREQTTVTWILIYVKTIVHSS